MHAVKWYILSSFKILKNSILLFIFKYILPVFSLKRAYTKHHASACTSDVKSRTSRTGQQDLKGIRLFSVESSIPLATDSGPACSPGIY